MRVDIQVDCAALRRNRRGMLLGFVAFALYLPAVLATLAAVAALFGRDVASHSVGLAFLIGLVAPGAVLIWGARDALLYHCPRCDRRLSRGVPQNQPEPNIHYHCPDCRVVWDLGWGPAGGGGVGG